MKYYKNEEDLYDDIVILENVRKDEIDYYNSFDNNKTVLIEGTHTIYEYPSDKLINTINTFIEN